MRQWPRIHSFQRSAAIPSADETQNTVSVVVAHSPVFGSRLQTVRSRRSTVLISFSHGVRRNHALTGNTVNSRVSQRLRPFALLVAHPLGLRPMAPSSSLRRRVGWLSLTWVSRWLPEAITRALSHCRRTNAKGPRILKIQAAVTASRHVFIAAARKVRCVAAE